MIQYSYSYVYVLHATHVVILVVYSFSIILLSEQFNNKT